MLECKQFVNVKYKVYIKYIVYIEIHFCWGAETKKSTTIPLCPNCTLCLWPLSLSISNPRNPPPSISLSCPSSLFSFFFFLIFFCEQREISWRPSLDMILGRIHSTYRSVHICTKLKKWLKCRSVICPLKLNSAGYHLENINLFFYILFHIILLMRLSRSIN